MKSVLINPNIATIQTDTRFADQVYLLPVNPEYVESIIEKERPDGIVMLSIFSLPDNVEQRNKILNLAVENNVELHFANERIVLKNEDDIKLIQGYLEFSPS